MSKTDAATDDGYGIKYLAEQLGTEPQNVRHALRRLKVEKTDNRYSWSRKSDADAVVKQVKAKMAADKEAAKDRPKPTFGRKAKEGDAAEAPAKGAKAKVNKDAGDRAKADAKKAKDAKGKGKGSKDKE